MVSMGRGPRAVIFALGLLALGAKPGPGRVRKVDRMWVVGRPALDAAPEGIYAWVADGHVRFAVSAGPEGSASKVYRFTVRAKESLRLEAGGECKVAARAEGRRGLVLAARPGSALARCGLRTKEEVTISKARERDRVIPIFVGPRARRAAAAVRIGAY
ncbi:MAG: hypothetical protein AAFZ18_17625 [Myxococcota bacterium]